MWRFLICVLALAPIVGQGQSTKSDIRGFVYDGDNGDRSVASVITAVKDKSDGTVVRSILSDNDGYYALTGLTPGDYWVRVYHAGFDTLYEKVKVFADVNTKKDFYLQHISTMDAVEISVKGKARDAQVGVTNIEARAIYKMPAVGAEPDILQYLQVLPGVVFSGDQGGQLYIRGGSPIMNKVMMDGLTIYNPFHSIGLFSVFETDLIQTADVYSAGFGSEYGGRVSAVVDIKTRDGNRKRMAGKVLWQHWKGFVDVMWSALGQPCPWV